MPRTKKQVETVAKPAYFLEWEASKVAPEIIEKNVKFVAGNEAYEALLWALGQDSRTNNGQLRQKYLYRYNHLYSGGWFCSTLDPLAGFSRSEWGCLKPLEPKEKDGKLIKYEHPPATETRAFYLEIGEAQQKKIADHWEIGTVGNFWQWVVSQPSIPVVITEGAKKAGSLLSAGYPAIALPGVNSGYRTLGEAKELSEDLLVIAQAGREIIFAFDEDERFKTQKMVASAILETGKLFQKEGCKVSVLSRDPKSGKGIDDFIASHGEDALHQSIGDRLSLAEFSEKKIRKVRKFTHNAHFLDYLRECELDKKLKYNLLSLEIELDGKQFDEPEWFYMWFCDKYSVEVSEKIFFQSVFYFANNNKYHPVRDYLESVADLPPVDLDTAAARYFGLTDSISNLLLKRWLIGCVARANRPGCKLHGALILFGKTGHGKSTFFEKLGGPFYGGDVDEIRGKDNLLKQHSYWILECQEFDQITSKSQAAALKGWITTDVDNIRPPYGRKASPHRRGFAIGGSVNDTEFLSDPTGSRRFWILDIGNKFINNELVEAERDNLWAAAVQAYNAGDSWHLTHAEESQISEGNKRYQISDDWTGIVEQYCAYRNAVCVIDILTQSLDFKEKEITRRESMRVTNVLTGLGWVKIGQRRDLVEGRSRRASYWVRSEIIEAIEQGKLPSDAELSEIQEFDLNASHDSGSLTIPAIPPVLTTPNLGGIDGLNANDSNDSGSLTIPTIPFADQNKKEKNTPETAHKPEPKIDPYRAGRIHQINIYKEALNLTSDHLRSLSLAMFEKDDFTLLTNDEIRELDDYLFQEFQTAYPDNPTE